MKKHAHFQSRQVASSSAARTISSSRSARKKPGLLLVVAKASVDVGGRTTTMNSWAVVELLEQQEWKTVRRAGREEMEARGDCDK